MNIPDLPDLDDDSSMTLPPTQAQQDWIEDLLDSTGLSLDEVLTEIESEYRGRDVEISGLSREAASEVISYLREQG